MAKPRLTFVAWDTCPTAGLAADGLRQVYASTLSRIVKVDLTLYLDLIYEQIFATGDLVGLRLFYKGKNAGRKDNTSIFPIA